MLQAKVGSVDHAASFFQAFGAAVQFVNSTVPSLHSIPTVSTGTPCGVEGNYTERAPHGLGACGYDGAGAAVAHIYGPLKPPGAFASGRLLAFDQHKFDGSEVGLDDHGWVYVGERVAVYSPRRSRGYTCLIAGRMAEAEAWHGGCYGREFRGTCLHKTCHCRCTTCATWEIAPESSSDGRRRSHGRFSSPAVPRRRHSTPLR